jgi:Transposase
MILSISPSADLLPHRIYIRVQTHRLDAQEAGMNKFSGIDLHSNNSVVVVSDEADRIAYQRRLPNDQIEIRAALAPHRGELVGVVIEATYNWYWLVDALIEDGYRVHLANPAAIRQYEGLKYSGAFTDAAHLAQLLRLGLLPEGYIYPRQGRQVRDLDRSDSILGSDIDVQSCCLTGKCYSRDCCRFAFFLLFLCGFPRSSSELR